MTAADLIRQALLDVEAVGYADTVPALLTADGLIVLNNLISSWNAEDLLIPSITKVTKILTAAIGQYTLGSGGDVNITRPMTIESAWISDSSNTSTILELKIMADYANIKLKLHQGRPEELFYNPAYPLGTIFLWPVPDQGYTLNLDLKSPLSRIALSTDTINTPDDWLRALQTNLAYELAPRFDVEDILVIKDKAQESKDSLKLLHSQPGEEVSFDLAALGRRDNFVRDINSDI